MKILYKRSISSGLMLVLFTGFCLANSGNQEKIKEEVSNAFTAFPADQIRLQGYLGNKIDLCIKNRIIAQDAQPLIKPFKHHNETKLWQTEFWGKWITSAIGAYEYNRNPQLLAIIKNAVYGLVATQSQDGYIGNYADDAHLQQWDIWGRKYTLLGLLAYYELNDDKKVLSAARLLADHLLSEVGPGKVNIVNTGNYRGMPSSSFLEPIVLLYKDTGEKRYLDFARYIVRQWETPEGPRLISNALADIDVADRFPHPSSWWSWENGQKAYEMMSCYEGLLELYRVTGESLYLEAVEDAVQNIIDTEINIAGSGSAFECWYHGNENQIYPSYHTMETCVTMTWMKLCYNLLRMTGNSMYADQIEKSTYNALLASMLPDGSYFAKYSPLEGSRSLGENQCGMNINCCVANGPRAIFMLPVFAVMKSRDGIAVNLYCQSESKVLIGKNNRVLVNQETDYPESGRINLEISPEQEEEFTLCLRIPGWSERTLLKINGQPVDEIISGTYKKIHRVWKMGDRLELNLDMRGRIEKINHYYALERGPVVLARDSRFDDGFIDESSKVEEQDGYIQLKHSLDSPEGIWMSFYVPLLIGTNLEDKNAVKQIGFCDYASAGNNWSEESRYRVWLYETLDVRK